MGEVHIVSQVVPRKCLHIYNRRQSYTEREHRLYILEVAPTIAVGCLEDLSIVCKNIERTVSDSSLTELSATETQKLTSRLAAAGVGVSVGVRVGGASGARVWATVGAWAPGGEGRDREICWALRYILFVMM